MTIITLNVYGCTSPYSQGGAYNPDATVDDGSCVLIGCSDSTFAEYYNQGFYSMKRILYLIKFFVRLQL